MPNPTMPDAAPHGLDAFAAPIRAALAAALELDADTIQLERPKNEAHGEFALPCFRFAKAAGKNPAELAGHLAATLEIPQVSAEAVGPFLNFQIDRTALTAQVLGDAGQEGFGIASTAPPPAMRTQERSAYSACSACAARGREPPIRPRGKLRVLARTIWLALQR